MEQIDDFKARLQTQPVKDLLPEVQPVTDEPSRKKLAGFDSFIPVAQTNTDDDDLSVPIDKNKAAKIMQSEDVQAAFIQIRSSFPASRRPIYLINYGTQVKYNCAPSAYTSLIRNMDVIIKQRPSRAGLIHTISYDMVRQIVNLSSNSDRMITHGDIKRKPGEEDLNTPTLAGAIRLHNEYHTSGSILVSPAITTGNSFPDDLCRFVMFAKAPYPNITSKLIRVRVYLDETKNYIPNKVAQVIDQGLGRGRRSMQDWCECFLFGTVFMSYAYGGKHRYLLPSDLGIKYWKAASGKEYPPVLFSNLT